MNNVQIAVYGAGGFAREVTWLIERSYGNGIVKCYVDDNKFQHTLKGIPVLTFNEVLESHPGIEIALGIGAPATRKMLADKCTESGLQFARLIDPGVSMSSSVDIGVGAIICNGSILTVDISIAEHVHINLDCTIGHDVKIGAFTTLSPGVHVSGNVHIGEEVYIGTGATIINGNEDEPLIIADRTVIGAGACVTKPTEAGCLYAGLPAILKKRY
jgi:sugar O-acyltransferase (sialic acid O-acetyltransferase NeuD family)